jgi:hypothetical protein
MALLGVDKALWLSGCQLAIRSSIVPLDLGDKGQGSCRAAKISADFQGFSRISKDLKKKSNKNNRKTCLSVLNCLHCSEEVVTPAGCASARLDG